MPIFSINFIRYNYNLLTPESTSLTEYIEHSFWGGKYISTSVVKKR